MPLQERRVAREEDALIRFAILRNCDPPVELDQLRRKVERATELQISNRSIANMAATLHRVGFLRYRSKDGLGYGDYLWLTDEGRAVIRYFGALA